MSLPSPRALYFSLALKGSRVIAWGDNSYGQTTVPSRAQSGVTAIAASHYHSLALKDGRVIAWGENTNGESTVPPAAQSGVTAIAAGGFHSLALWSPLPVVAVARHRASEPEGVPGTSRTFRFEVTLSTPSTQTVMVTWHTEDRTATAGVDYLATQGTLRFQPGETERLIRVTVLGDNVVEPTESFVVKLDHADGATIATGETAGPTPAGAALGRIRDNE